jgi:hypothetical protein
VEDALRDLGASQLLEEWRTAARRLASRDPDASDFEEMTHEVDRLRAEYQRVSLGTAVGDQLQAAARGTGRLLSRAVGRASDRSMLRTTLESRGELVE